MHTLLLENKIHINIPTLLVIITHRLIPEVERRCLNNLEVSTDLMARLLDVE